jgi:hypothetical protein
VAFFVFYPSVVGRPPLAPGDFRVSVESLESEGATVALLDEGEGLPRVIWILEETERG